MSAAKGVSEVNGVKEYKYFAGGEWRSAERNKLFDVHQPYDRALYARVADASVMPSITAGATNAPSIMIGGRAAVMIMASGQQCGGSR